MLPIPQLNNKSVAKRKDLILVTFNNEARGGGGGGNCNKDRNPQEFTEQFQKRNLLGFQKPKRNEKRGQDLKYHGRPSSNPG